MNTENIKVTPIYGRIWNWAEERWLEHCKNVKRILGYTPEKPAKPDADDEAMVMLEDYGFTNIPKVKYVRDMIPADYNRVNAYLPSVNQMKKIYGKKTNQ